MHEASMSLIHIIMSGTTTDGFFLLSTYTWYISIYDSTEVSKKSFFACVEILVPRILFHRTMSNL